MANDHHPFFTLPPELHTHIFTLACTPSVPTRRGGTACSAVTGPSYYTSFYTGLALSRVSKYINVASAPARYRSVVLYGWREISGFERVFSTKPSSTRNQSRVRYLTLVADELPTSACLLTKDKLRGFSARSLLTPPSSSSSSRAGAGETPLELEQTFLRVIARILRSVGNDLYELEIGFHAIERVKNPLAYLNSLSGGLCFPQLETMFYACPPSNALPWGMDTSTDMLSSTLASSTLTVTAPHLSCPNLKDLTVVCNDCNSNSTSFQGGNVDTDHDQAQDDIPDIGAELREAEATRDDEETGSGLNVASTFPSLTTVTLLASTPAQGLMAIDVDEAGWDVGSPLAIDEDELRHRITGCSHQPESNNEDYPGPQPPTLYNVVLRPKTQWNERWESLKDVVMRQREAKKEVDSGNDGKNQGRVRSSSPSSDATTVGRRKLGLFVLKPGEQL